MTSVRFSGTSAANTTWTDFMARQADRVFTTPERIGTRVDAFVKRKSTGSLLDKAVARLAQWGGGLAKMLTNFDYHEFPEVSLGKLKGLVAEPPIGALILLLYPFTVGPRLYRAYERGKKNGNDFREVGDVLRRDMTAITIFLFMLKPLLKAMNKVMQKVAGLELVDLKEDKVLTFSQMKNYRIDSPDALVAMLKEGNGKGLLKAIATLNDRGLFEKTGRDSLKKHIEAIQKLAPELHTAYENGRPDTVRKLSEAIYQHFDDLESIRARMLKSVEQGGDAKLAQMAKALQGEFKDVVTKYGKSRLLPVAVAGFAIVIGAIGWFPVWFNAFWNKSKFEQEQAAKRAADLSSYNPALTWQALQSKSALAQRSSFRRFNV